MAELTFSGSYEPLSESFREHYLKFVGNHSKTLLDSLTNADSISLQASQKPFQSPSWLRPGLMGVGSVAATLVIGSALTEQANSQLHPPDYPEVPQPDLLSESPVQRAAAATASSPAAIASLSPTPPEMMDSIEVQASRRPFRELLAERLQQRSYNPQVLNPGLQAAIAQTSRSSQTQAPITPSATQEAANPPNSTIALADLPQLQAAPAGSLNSSTDLNESPSPEQASAVNTAEISNIAPSGTTPSGTTTSNNATSNNAPANSLAFDESIVLEKFILGTQVSAPERIESSQVSAIQGANTPQENSSEAASLQAVPTPASFALPLSNVRIQRLTPEQALKISQMNETQGLRVVRLSPQFYQQLWATMNTGEPSPAPVYGFLDQEQQTVMIPVGDRDGSNLSVGQ
jgi:hypothetical protein